MKNSNIVLAAVGASLFSSSAFANSENDTLDQIIVTGARAPISVGDVGSAVTVITRDDIERRQVRFVSELLRAVPGFAVSHTGVIGSQTQVRVRGSEANHVLVLVDGIRANDPATGDEFRWEYLATANIERIEVVRGAQSALWGSDAVAGVVHIITRSGAGSSGFGAYLEGGSDDTVNAAINGSLNDDHWSLGFGLEQLTTDGSNIARTGSEKDDSDVTTGSLNVTFRPNDVVSLQLGARHVDAYSQFDAVDFFTTGLPADSDVATDTTQDYVQLGGSFGADDARVRHQLTARYFDSDNRNLVDGLEGSSSASDRTTFGYQADIAFGRNRLSLAAEHERTQFEQRGAVNFGDPNQDQETDTTSAIVDFQGRAGDQVTYLLSARFDNHSDFDDALTGRASIAWRASEALTLRANIGTGQKTPTFTERFGFFPEQFIGNSGLEPEHSLSYDVGLTYRISNASSIELAVFEQDITDEINGFVFDPVSSLFTAENLDTDSKRSGVELSTRWALSETIGLDVNYTYTDATQNSSRELRRPRHAGSVQLDYAFMASRGRVSLAADYGGTRQDVFFPPFPNPQEVVTLSNYWLVDLTAQFAVSESLTVFARTSNLLDTEYEQVYGYRTQGRSTYAGVRASFGK
ncbi:MAG: TonB-dependent receptor [Woeseiaceae bacterium]|nr:TonB-dependent receptor [Woeseiaceae bacterium]